MSATVYLTDDLVGVAWDDRGPIHVLHRDGAASEQHAPPHGAEVLSVDDGALDSLEQAALEGAIARMRGCDAGRKLSKRTLDALAAAIEDQRGEYAGKTA